MKMFKDKAATFRHFNLAAGVGGLVASGSLFYRGQIALAFLVAFTGLSFIAAGETDADLTTKYSIRSLPTLLTQRMYISTLGKLCDIASWFCLAAALISWLVLR
jgi:hypothetical protein